jgi:crossover junction endodeoxyribonuclease RusA
VIRVKVHGIPAPQGSKRHVGKGVMIESSKAVAPWRERVAHETQDVIEAGQQPYDHEPVLVRIMFYLPRPQNHYGSRKGVRYVKDSAPSRPVTMKKNDIDKLARAVLDGITEGGALRDDGQVASLDVDKYYANETFPPGAMITIIGLS